jgi:hypothetical protein
MGTLHGDVTGGTDHLKSSEALQKIWNVLSGEAFCQEEKHSLEALHLGGRVVWSAVNDPVFGLSVRPVEPFRGRPNAETPFSTIHTTQSLVAFFQTLRAPKARTSCKWLDRVGRASLRIVTIDAWPARGY